MSIEQIKQRMKAYKDFYGGNLICLDEIEAAATKRDLSNLIEKHRTHMECMLCDAMSHIDNFKKSLKIPY